MHPNQLQPKVFPAKKLVIRIVVLLLILAVMTPAIPFSLANQPARAQVIDEHTVFLPLLNKQPVVTTPTNCGQRGGDWPMVAANPQRTSWTSEEVCGNLQVEWYLPIEAYISQNVQIIAAHGLLYISTAKGLYALNAATGAVAWRYDTELPLGNSPTYSDGVVYVGGYDRELHALDAATGHHLWSFAGAHAGYDTNPLVVDGIVFIGNRDGNMYAIGAHGTSHQGQMLWKYQTGGPIDFSAAYLNGKVYFASNDNYAYALNADNGNLVWKSEKLPGDGYHSYWPVVYRDYVIFTSAPGYRHGEDPGVKSVEDGDGDPYTLYATLQVDNLFPDDPFGTDLGPEIGTRSWSNGYPVIDGSRVTEFTENRPNPSLYEGKPWHRIYIALDTNTGHEYSFDSDGDGFGEYIPAAHWGTRSGNRFPPISDPAGILYFSNIYTRTSDSQGRVMGWVPGSPELSVLWGQGAIVEPQALSGGGNLIYRSLCCDRVGDYFSIYRDGVRRNNVWSYNLASLAPGYNEMWTSLGGNSGLWGFYSGTSNTTNGTYHNHGVQNPIVPYQGRLYIHRSNAIIAFGPGPSRGKLSSLYIQPGETPDHLPAVSEIQQRLATEIQKIIDAGLLRPGYYNALIKYDELDDYFNNPGETLYTLAMAYPHLSADLQSGVRAYMEMVFDEYFNPSMYTTTGWNQGAAREWMPLPPEVENDLANFTPAIRAAAFSWEYPQHNFYAMWKFAQILPQHAQTAYSLAKSKLQVPVPNIPGGENDYFRKKPYELNAYIAGYTGFLNLQTLAGMSGQDSTLRTQVQNELNRLLALRWQTFSKDSYWVQWDYLKHLDLARNFMYLVPEIGDAYRQNINAQSADALDEYQYIAPYWFVNRYDGVIGEGTMSNLYNSWSIFTAKAMIMGASYDELVQYIDVPAFERGDLYYIQKLVLTLQAPRSNVRMHEGETLGYATLSCRF